MKSNLSLIQPKEYNHLFSSYHSNNKLTNLNIKLPKISNLFSSQQYKEKNDIGNNTSTFFNKKIKLDKKTQSGDNNIYKKQRQIIYPLLNISLDINESNNKTNIEILPSTAYHSYKANNVKIIKKNKKDISNKGKQLNMVYLDLFKSPSQNKNKNILNIDSFYNGIDDFENKNNNDIEILSQKLNEINNKSIITIKNIFNETDFGKLNNDILSINDMSKGIIDKYVEKIFNRNRYNDNINDNNDYLNGEKHNLITNNVFLDWILENVKRKIELKNEFNQHLTTVWVKNLVYREINELKNRFGQFKKSMNFSKFLEYMNYKRKNNKKALKKNEKSNLTSSTFRSYFENSNLKTFVNNSNINSYYYENEKKFKNTLTQDSTINDMTLGFDFFDNNNSRKYVNFADNQVNNINSQYITHGNLIKNLNNSHNSKKSLNNKNKTELNNIYKRKGNELFKNIYLSNQRCNKVKNIENPILINIKSKIDNFNKTNIKQNKNDDIIDKIIKEKINKTIRKDQHQKYNYTPKKIFFTPNRRRNTFNYSNNEEKYLILKLRIKDINIDKRSVTPSKEIKIKKEGDKTIKPNFKNIILKDNIKNKKREKIISNSKADNSNKSISINNIEYKKNESRKKVKKISKPFSYFGLNEGGEKEGNKKKNQKKTKILNSTKIKKKQNFKNTNDKNNNINLNLNDYSSSSETSNEEEEKEEEKDKFVDMKKDEITQIMKRSLVSKRHKTEKPKLSLVQINKLKNIIKKNQLQKKEEEEEEQNSISLNSISSIDEKEELNENLQIKKEIDLLNDLLSNNDSYNLFSLLLELKKYLRIRNKDEVTIKNIKIKKIDIKNIIDKYFEILLSKLSIQEIKYEKQHIEIFKQLDILKKYGLYTLKELNDLEDRILLERREEEIDENDYVNEYDKEEQKSEYSRKRSTSIDPVFRRRYTQKLKTFKGNKFKKFFKEKKNLKKNLIFNNSYLLKENEENDSDDEDKNNLLIKKEIQDILNTDYGNIPVKMDDTSISFSNRRKSEEYIKKEYQKKKVNRNFVKLKDELLDEEILLKNRRLYEESEEKLRKEEIRDKRIYDFFSKIQKLKNDKTNKNDEFNSFIDEQIEKNKDIPKGKDMGRLNYFLQEFNNNRIRAKYEMDLKNKRIGFISPIIFTSPNETFNFTKGINFK